MARIVRSERFGDSFALGGIGVVSLMTLEEMPGGRTVSARASL